MRGKKKLLSLFHGNNIRNPGTLRRLDHGNIKPGFMIDLAHKDLGLGLETTAKLHTPAFLGAAARQAYSIAQSKGQGRNDWTAIYLTLRNLAGLEPTK